MTTVINILEEFKKHVSKKIPTIKWIEQHGVNSHTNSIFVWVWYDIPHYGAGKFEIDISKDLDDILEDYDLQQEIKEIANDATF